MRIGVVTTSYPRFAGDPAGSFVAAHVAATRALGHDVDVIAAGTGPDRIASPLFYGAGAPDELERGARGATSFTLRLALAVAWRARPGIGSSRTGSRRRRSRRCPRANRCSRSRTAATSTPCAGLACSRRHCTCCARGARLAFVSDELLALARAAAPSLASWLADAAIVQPMGLPLARFTAIERSPEPTLLVVARLVHLKGVDVAIRAARELGMRLVVAGDGPERATLERLGGAHFTGAVAPDARDRLLASAAAVIVPSRILPSGRTEGMPTIALEALAAGVPVVASAVGGLRALAPAARLVAPDDPRALAAAIAEVVSARPASMLRSAVAHLDWSRVAPRLLAHAAGGA